MYRHCSEPRFGQDERQCLEMLMAALPGVGRRIALAHGFIDARRPLTRRERETLHHLLAGRSEKQIAAAMDLSERTLHHRVTALFHKFDVQSRAGYGPVPALDVDERLRGVCPSFNRPRSRRSRSNADSAGRRLTPPGQRRCHWARRHRLRLSARGTNVELLTPTARRAAKQAVVDVFENWRKGTGGVFWTQLSPE